MKQLLEFLPLVIFFWAYFAKTTLQIGDLSLELGDIYSATALLMLSMLIQMILTKLIYKEIEKRSWATFAVVIIFGTLTLVLKNKLFIQWKPSIVNWGFALALLIGPYFTNGEPLIKKGLGKQIQMPDNIWDKVTRFLIYCSIFLGLLNILVVYSFSEATWVKFKLYSAIASSIITTGVIMYMVAPYLNTDNTRPETVASSEPDNDKP